MLDPFVVILYLCNTYIISLFKKLYILLLCLCVLIKYYCFFKKRKKKKSTLGTRVTFCFEPIFLYWATLTKQKKKPYASPIQSIAKRNPSHATVEKNIWPQSLSHGPQWEITDPTSRGQVLEAQSTA